MGLARLVPPYTAQPPSTVEYTAAPVAGSATPATWATGRLEQPMSSCQAGFASYWEQPLPAPAQADSAQPREAPGAGVSEVPPTAVTDRDAAGYCTP